MYQTANRTRLIGLALSTAMAGALVSGCTSNAAPPAAVSAGKAEAALAKGKHEQAIAAAEQAVLAEPRNTTYRAMLGAAYMDGGRFASAAQAYADARELGDNSARTALSLALSLSATGKGAQAIAVLESAQNRIAASDLGLAYTLAGNPERGVHILSNALRGGENTAKVRQNLAYSFAMAGMWREARLMVAEDVPADKVPDRIAQWAQVSQQGYEAYRIAQLLDVPVVYDDAGQPAMLAVENNPSIEQLAAESLPSPEPAPQVAAARAAGHLELAAVDVPVSTARAPVAASAAQPGPANFQAAFPTPSPVRQDTNSLVREAVADSRPVASAAKTATAMNAIPAVENGRHLVQLGSFSSEAGAKRAWGIYLKHYPELANHEPVITEAVVRGKHYWRVSAASYDQDGSQAMCGRVKRSGEGCFAYHEARPLPGAVDTGMRLASR